MTLRPIVIFVCVQVLLLSGVVWLARRHPGRLDKLWASDAQLVLVVIPRGLPRPENLPALEAIARGRSVVYVALRREDVPDHALNWFKDNHFPLGTILTPGLGLGDGTLEGLLKAVGLERLQSTPWVIVPADFDDRAFINAHLRILRLGIPKPVDAPDRSIIGASDWNEARNIIETSRSSR